LALFIFLLVSILYVIPCYRIVAPKINFGGNPFAFRGSIGKFLLKNLLGIFLSIITLGIYFPWYITKISRYLFEELSYSGTALGFKSKGGKLFLIMLATLVLPMAIIIAGVTALAMNMDEKSPIMMLVVILIYIIMIPFAYKMYQWYANGITWGKLSTHWNTYFFRSTVFILGQMLFSIVTVGIGFPAAVLFLYRYFVNRTVALDGETEAGKFRFEGEIGYGFLLLWGQILLSIVTLGIYIPWAFSKTGKWLLANTTYETGK
jgi:uncharacterized membrane protein YjgN (DUF898 family)